MKDKYGNEYELISGRTYKTKGDIGNIACLTEYQYDQKRNNGLCVIFYGKIERGTAKKAIMAMGWNPKDWL